MLLRNIRPAAGLCNGTRLQVVRLDKYIIVAKVLTGPGKGEHAMIPRIRLSDSLGKFPFKLQRLQFPVRPAFAMTINKTLQR
jgi:ATP-dependent DNA helicase PIF1